MEAETKRAFLNVVELMRDQEDHISELALTQHCLIEVLGLYDRALQQRIGDALEKVQGEHETECELRLHSLEEFAFRLKSHSGV